MRIEQEAAVVISAAIRRLGLVLAAVRESERLKRSPARSGAGRAVAAAPGLWTCGDATTASPVAAVSERLIVPITAATITIVTITSSATAMEATSQNGRRPSGVGPGVVVGEPGRSAVAADWPAHCHPRSPFGHPVPIPQPSPRPPPDGPFIANPHQTGR